MNQHTQAKIVEVDSNDNVITNTVRQNVLNVNANNNVQNNTNNETQNNERNEKQSFDQQETEYEEMNDRLNSYVEINDNKFTKYYFEPANTSFFNNKSYIIINQSILECEQMTELNITKYISQKLPNLIPALYENESYDIPFDVNIFTKIYNHIHFQSSDVQLKKIVSEYANSITLYKYLVRNGLIVDEHLRIVSNDVTVEAMITIYKHIFTYMLNLIDNDIIPYDLCKPTNIMLPNDINSDYKIVDVGAYLHITNRDNTITNNDIFIHTLYDSAHSSYNYAYNLFQILTSHKEAKYITTMALQNLVSQETIDYIITNLINDDRLLFSETLQLKQMLLGDENRFSTSITNILNSLVVSPKNISIMHNNMLTIFHEDNIVLETLYSATQIRKIYDIIYNKYQIDAPTQEYVRLYLNRGSIQRILIQVKYVMENTKNTQNTFYVNIKCPILGYTDVETLKSLYPDIKENEIQTKTTEKYILLIQDNMNCSVQRKFIGQTQQDTKYPFDGYLCVDYKIIPTTYFVFDYTIEVS